MIGAGGEVFADALRTSLASKYDLMADKLEEGARFVEIEVEQIRAAARSTRTFPDSEAAEGDAG